MRPSAHNPRPAPSAVAHAPTASLRLLVDRGIRPTDRQDPPAALSLVLGVNRGVVD